MRPKAGAPVDRHHRGRRPCGREHALQLEDRRHLVRVRAGVGVRVRVRVRIRDRVRVSVRVKVRGVGLGLQCHRADLMPMP